MQKLWVLWLLGLVFVFCCNADAQIDADQYQWQLKKDASGVQVFTSKVSDSKYLAVSAVMEVEASADSVAALIMDLKNCKKWAAQCSEAYVHERVSGTETYIYSRNNIPFPGRDRDAVTHVNWSKDGISGVISMSSSAVEGKVDKVKGVIRITQANAKWRFTPKEDGIVLVESFAHVDPASDMPKWLLNSLLVGSPYKTMKKIRSRLSEGVYDGASLNF